MISKNKVLLIILWIICALTCFGIEACKNDENKKVEIVFITPYEEIDSINYVVGEELILPTPSPRVGYIFDCWTLDPEGIVEATVKNIKLYCYDEIEKGQIKMYARWSVAYSLTYELNGGKISEVDVEYYKEGEHIKLPTATRNQENFLGWSRLGKIYEPDSIFVMPAENIVLKAEFGNKIVKVTFISEIKIDVYDLFVGSDGIVNEPDFGSVSGYRYDGCYTDKNYTWKFDFDNNRVFDSVSLYVKFVRVYTVRFETFGGSYIPPQQVDVGGYVTRPKEIPIKDGAVFRNWYAESSCKVEFVFELTPIIYDFVIYAGYDRLFTLSFDLSGGDVVDGDVSDRYLKENEMIALPTLEKEGMKFLGWYYNGEIFSASSVFIMPAENVLLIAEWEPLSIKVQIFDWDGTAVFEGNLKMNTIFELPTQTVPMLKLEEFSGFKIISGETDSSEIYKAENLIFTEDIKLRIAYNYDFNFETLSEKEIQSSFEFLEQYDEIWETTAYSLGYKSKEALKYNNLNFKMPVSYKGKLITATHGSETRNFSYSQINKIYFPSSYTSIGNDSFKNCKALREVEFADNSYLIKIGKSCFSDCDRLTDIVLPEGLTEIGERAFENCVLLTNPTLPSSIKILDAFIFNGCVNIEAFNVRESEDNYIIAKNGVIFSKTLLKDQSGKLVGYSEKYNQLLYYPFNKNSVSYEIPAEVEAIGAGAFYGSSQEISKLKTITFARGSRLNLIKEYAFAYLSSLTEITFPSSLEKIYSYAFAGIGATLIFSEGMKILGCESEDLNNGTVYASFAEFYGIVRVPASVRKISNGAFNEYKGEKIIFDQNSVLQQIGDFAFYYAENLKSINLPDSVIEIGDYAFYECGSLVEFKLPESLNKVGKYAFYNAWLNDDIDFPSGLNEIGDRAFYFNGVDRYTENK